MGIHSIPGTGYKYSLGGVNFDDFSQVKMLTLDNTTTTSFKTLHCPGSTDYAVPGGKALIAFLFLVYNQDSGMVGRIGESGTADQSITKNVIKAANGTDKPSMEEVFGVFAENTYVTASDYLKSGTVLYGIEVDA